MIKKIMLFGWAIVWLAGCSTGVDEGSADAQIKQVVDRAAALIEAEGRGSFAKIASEEFYQGEQYVFVMGTKGRILVHPAKPELVGKIQTDIKNDEGREVIKEIIAAVKTADSAWLEYTWPKPGAVAESAKRSYIRKVGSPKGSPFIVGAGYYP